MNTYAHTRKKRRPSGAFKLLTMLLYGNYRYLEVGQDYAHLSSISRLGYLIGTDSKQMKIWLAYLEDMGYIESLSYTANRQQARFRIRRPPNVR